MLSLSNQLFRLLPSISKYGEPKGIIKGITFRSSNKKSALGKLKIRNRKSSFNRSLIKIGGPKIWSLYPFLIFIFPLYQGVRNHLRFT